MLMFDRILHIASDDGEAGKGSIVAELDINPDLWFFGCHFIGDPVMPGCLGLDAMWQLVGFFLGWSAGRGRALGAGECASPGSDAGDQESDLSHHHAPCDFAPTCHGRGRWGVGGGWRTHL